MTARRAAAADADARTAEEHHAAMLDHDPLQDDGEAQDIQQQEADEDDEEEEDEDAVVEYDDGLDIYESGSVSGSTETLTWISWFCALPGHEYFTEVTEDFIEDDFNLTGLNALVPFYKEALEMILDVEPPEEESLKIPDVSIVESSAELLYGLIHQRYILTRQGLQQMVEKYEAGHFGYCPRVYCHSHPVLPCGRSDLPGLDTVKLFCPNCIDNYAPPSSRFHGVDGAFFGTTFPHLLFQTYRELAPSPIAPRGTNAQSLNATQARPVGGDSSAAADSGEAGGDSGAEAVAKASEEAAERAKLMARMTLKPEQLGRKVANARIYTPRIYGFRVSEHAKSGPRMRWMRMRPESLEELELGAAPTSANVAEPAAGQSEAPQ
ncbi:casein kinase 2 regulatory subunit [Thecaphora frezii]